MVLVPISLIPGKSRTGFFCDSKVDLHKFFGTRLYRPYIIMCSIPDLRFIVHVPVTDPGRVQSNAGPAKPVIKMPVLESAGQSSR